MKLRHYAIIASIAVAAKFGYTSYFKESWPTKKDAAQIITQNPRLHKVILEEDLTFVCKLHTGTIAESYVFRHGKPIMDISSEESYWLILWGEKGYAAHPLRKEDIPSCA